MWCSPTFSRGSKSCTPVERKLQTKSRKRKAINTKPLTEPLAMWDTLTVQEKHDVAAEMIEVVYISHHSEDIEIRFGI